MPEVTNEDQALAMLDLDDSTPEVTPDTSGTVETPVETEVKEVEEEPVDKSAEERLAEAEEKRKGFQAEADKAKAEAERIRLRAEALERQNQQLMGVVQPFLDKYDKPNETSGPPKADYKDEFGNVIPEKLDDYLAKKDAWLLEESEKRALNKFQAFQQEQSVKAELPKIAEKFPQFVDPLTNKVDAKRVQEAIEAKTGELGLSGVVNLLFGQPETPGAEDTIQAIERNADKPSSVTASPESKAKGSKLSDDDKFLYETFGDYEPMP